MLVAKGDWRGLLRVLLDVTAFVVAYVVAHLLRFDGRLPPETLRVMAASLPLVVAARTLTFWSFGLFRGVWRYASAADLLALGKAVAAGSGLVLVCVHLIHLVPGPPGSVLIIDAIVVGLITGSLRLGWRLAATEGLRLRWLLARGGQRPARRVLIVGAGDAGESLLREMGRARNATYRAVAFADDDPVMQGKRIHEVPVAGGVEDIPRLVREQEVDDIFIAIPSATSPEMQRIVRWCRESGKPARSIPALGEAELVAGAYLSQLREVRLEDLFGRPTVALDLTGVEAVMAGKRVLVTGAGGSIGSELCHQILQFHPEQLVLFEKGENALFYVHRSLSAALGLPAADYRPVSGGPADGAGQAVSLVPILGDLTNREHIDQVIADYRPDFVFHAAAHKHVPLTEINPYEAVRNNVGGTRNLVAACGERGVRTLVLLSTDKAANPISIMGSTKRLCEAYVSAGAAHYGARFLSVRFGNVLESTGSVVRLFKEQLRQGKPLTVTHPGAKRYFMAKSEAVQLVLQAAVLGRGGEIFVLAMGEPVGIADVARELMLLSGCSPAEGPGIVFVGLRPGEKLVEELVGQHEEATGTGHPKILSLKAPPPEWRAIDQEIQTLLCGVEAGVDPQRLCGRLRLACEAIAASPRDRAAAPERSARDAGRPR